jgi:hypothetical protein
MVFTVLRSDCFFVPSGKEGGVFVYVEVVKEIKRFSLYGVSLMNFKNNLKMFEVKDTENISNFSGVNYSPTAFDTRCNYPGNVKVSYKRECDSIVAGPSLLYTSTIPFFFTGKQRYCTIGAQNAFTFTDVFDMKVQEKKFSFVGIDIPDGPDKRNIRQDNPNFNQELENVLFRLCISTSNWNKGNEVGLNFSNKSTELLFPTYTKEYLGILYGGSNSPLPKAYVNINKYKTKNVGDNLEDTIFPIKINTLKQIPVDTITECLKNFYQSVYNSFVVLNFSGLDGFKTFVGASAIAAKNAVILNSLALDSNKSIAQKAMQQIYEEYKCDQVDQQFGFWDQRKLSQKSKTLEILNHLETLLDDDFISGSKFDRIDKYLESIKVSPTDQKAINKFKLKYDTSNVGISPTNPPSITPIFSIKKVPRENIVGRVPAVPKEKKTSTLSDKLKNIGKKVLSASTLGAVLYVNPGDFMRGIGNWNRNRDIKLNKKRERSRDKLF